LLTKNALVRTSKFPLES